MWENYLFSLVSDTQAENSPHSVIQNLRSLHDSAMAQSKNANHWYADCRLDFPEHQ
jgi:hypothetical protein